MRSDKGLLADEGIGPRHSSVQGSHIGRETGLSSVGGDDGAPQLLWSESSFGMPRFPNKDVRETFSDSAEDGRVTEGDPSLEAVTEGDEDAPDDSLRKSSRRGSGGSLGLPEIDDVSERMDAGEPSELTRDVSMIPPPIPRPQAAMPDKKLFNWDVRLGQYVWRGGMGNQKELTVEDWGAKGATESAPKIVDDHLVQRRRGETKSGGGAWSGIIKAGANVAQSFKRGMSFKTSGPSFRRSPSAMRGGGQQQVTDAVLMRGNSAGRPLASHVHGGLAEVKESDEGSAIKMGANL